MTGWQSFGVIAEDVYNDVLLVVDLALLASYWLFLYYASIFSSSRGQLDSTLYIISGMIFMLYAVWDIVALTGSDTSAKATAQHLAKFARITFGIALSFFVLGVVASHSSPDNSALTWSRLLAGAIWMLVIGWWQFSRMSAAKRDAVDG
jgi:hypothetical protein